MFRPGLYFLILITGFSCKIKQAMPAPESPNPVFKKLDSKETGITFNNLVDENYGNYFDAFAYVYNGGGVAAGDINQDDLPDLYFTGNEVENKLYLNLGNLKFKDITEEAGVGGGPGWDNGVTMVDIDHNGLMDIYVCRGGWQDKDEQRKNLLYINEGNLRFSERAAEYGLDDPGYSIHAAFFDMDRDNDLDLYLTQRPDSFYLPLSKMISGKQNPPDKNRDKLYKNENGKFIDISKEAGLDHGYGYALAVVTADLNRDGWQDIYVSNDYADQDYLFINQQNGTFRESIKESTNHLSLFSMGADIADLNNDGWEDILVMEMLPENYKRSKVSMPRMDVQGFWAIVEGGMHRQYMHNALHLNHGNGFFSEISQLAGIAKTEWSWSTLAADFDNDGMRDIFVANGYRRDLFDGDIKNKLDAFLAANQDKYLSGDDFFTRGFKEFISLYDPIKVVNYLYRNKGELQFENVSAAWGFVDSSFSNGAAVADLDRDGDLDLIVNNLEAEAFLYENKNPGQNHFLKINLNGPEGNRQGIGSKITLYQGSGIQYFDQKTVRGYLSSNDPVVHFGLGKINSVDSVRVQWPDGKENLMKAIAANTILQVNYPEAQMPGPAPKPFPPLFSLETGALASPFKHDESPLDEYKDQVLLPHEFSKSGPFIATGDVNGDQNQDFYVGGAEGQAGCLYLYSNHRFVKQNIPVFEQDKAYEDMGASFFDADGDGDLDLYVVSGGSAHPEGSGLYQDRLYLNGGRGNFSKIELPKTISSGSCVLPFDLDGDGDLDIFRGGQVVPNRYPFPALSYLWINDKGKFTDGRPFFPQLASLGMVNSAVHADLNGDLSPELILTGEWMPIRIFEFKNGKMEEATDAFGLGQSNGWWNRIVADDIDGDGDPDLVAGNLGKNYKFSASPEKPFEVYATDFDRSGTNDIFLAKYDHGVQVPIRGRECSSQQMPGILQKFPSFLSFAVSDIRGILGAGIDQALHLKAYEFRSALFINENGKFQFNPLPVYAQLSTVNGILVRDFDGDGNKDILVAGNRFDVEVETSPADASPGMFLKGMGKNEFKAIGPLQSGFSVPYNVKDIQWLDTEGYRYILVGINDGPLLCFRVNP